MLAFEYIRTFFSRQQPAGATRPPCDFDLTSRYFHNRAATQTDVFQTIGADTAIDLDLEAVFERIDRTTSKPGQQYLYAQLRIPEGAEAVAAFDRRVEQFTGDPDLADRCTAHLSKLRDEESYNLQNLIFETPTHVAHIRLAYALMALGLLSIAAAPFYPITLLLLIPVFTVNAFLHYGNKLSVTNYLISVKQLCRGIRTARKLAAEPAISTAYDTSFLPQMAELERKSKALNMQGEGGSDFAAIAWLLLELFKIATNAELILFHRVTGSVAAHRDDIGTMFRFIGRIDAAISVALLRAEGATCKPEFTDRRQIEVCEMAHPLIEGCVKNSLTLDGANLLLTGSNMSGKTTFIRTMCVNALLAQTLSICFASHYAAPYMKLYTSIRITDDLAEGVSYYLEEVLTIRRFIEAATGTTPCLFALDELFKGTNTLERVAAGKAVLSRLGQSPHTVLVSTHDTELAELLRNEGYVLYHFREQVADDRLSFDYLLHEGPLTTRNAIRILELYGYPPEVVADALRTQEKLA